MKYQILKNVCIAFCVMLMVACSQQKTSDLGDFAAYIESLTQGKIHAEMPLTVHLAKPVSSETALEANLFAIKPDVKGSINWIDEYTVQFVPQEKFEYGKVYEVTFFLNKILEVPADYHVFRYQVETYPILFEISNIETEFNSREEEDLFELKGTVKFSDEISTDKLSKIFTCEYENRKQQIEFETVDGVNVDFTVKELRAQSSDQTLLFAWDGTPINSPLKGNEELLIPSSKVFEITAVTVNDAETQNPEIVVSFNKILDFSQNIDGLIYFKDDMNFTYQLKNNQITIYPNNVQLNECVLTVASGIKSLKGSVLERDYSEIISFAQVYPEVRFLGKGTILSGDNKHLLPFQAKGLKAVDVQVEKVFQNNMLEYLQSNSIDNTYAYDFAQMGRIVAAARIVLPQDKISLTEWKTYSIDLSKLIKNNDYSLYRVHLKFDQTYAVLKCEDIDNQQIVSEKYEITSEILKQYGEDGYLTSYYYPYNFDWSERNNPCSNSYYYHERFASKNVLVSNIGILAKTNDSQKNGYSFYVNNIETSAPIQGAKVQLYDYQKQLICEGSTDVDGNVNFKSELIRPYLAMAYYNGQGNYLKLGEGEALSVSHFDVSGTTVNDGLKAFIFTERDVVSPGDTLFLSVMLYDKEKTLPKNHPVVLEVTNSRYQLVKKETQTGGSNGLYLFKVPTTASAPTGMWTAKAIIGNQEFEKRIAVETIKPNRLKIIFGFGDKILTKSNISQKYSIQTDWLHGSPASGSEVVLSAFPSAIVNPFDGYKDYVFADHSRWLWTGETQIATGISDETGECSFNLTMPNFDNSPGMIDLSCVLRASTKSGDLSTASKKITYSPFSTYVGLKVPDKGESDYLFTDTTYQFDIVALDENGKLKKASNLRVEIFKTDNSWWWSGDGNSEASFVSANDDQIVFENTINAPKGKASFEWKIEYPDWGSYYVRVSDEGGHATGKNIYLDWPSWYSRNGREDSFGATLISMTSDKEVYEPGQKAKLSFPSNENGRALITIESGDKILKSFWKKTTAKETVVEIPIGESYCPNVYVSLTLIYANNVKNSDLPIRLYGTIPLMVESSKTKITPKVELPAELQPEAEYQVKVSETNGKSMSYILAVVDEGLLDITNFNTPDPHKSFFSKEALGVKTWDLYNDVLGAYGGRIDQVFAIGGGDAVAAMRKNAMKNRFVPVVDVLGPFTLSEKQAKTHTLKMPNYVGSVKVMVVATTGEAFGKTEQTAKVKKPVMVLATAPRFLCQDDKFALPVTVFSDLKKDGEIDVKLSVEGNVSIDGESTKKLNIKKQDEKIVTFNLKANSASGMSKIRVEASVDGDKAYDEIELSVTNPNSIVHNTYSKLLKPNESFVKEIDFHSEKDFRDLTVGLSRIPVPNLQSRLEYLNSYPYGCLEQTTSQAFAQLYLDKVVNLSEKDSLKRNASIRMAIQKITSMMTNEGQLPYWSGSNYVNEWSEIFAGHFMYLAFKEGYSVSESFLLSWRKNQEKKARVWEPDIFNGMITNDLVQSYRLYVLSLAGKSLLGQMNRLRENPKLTKNAANFLSMAYLIAGQENAARALTYGKNNFAETSDYYSYQTFSSQIQSDAVAALAFIAFKDNESAFPIISEITSRLSENSWLSTQSIAFGLYAYQEYAKSQLSGNPIIVNIKNYGKELDINTNDILTVEQLPTENQKITIENRGEGNVYCQIQQSEQPYISRVKGTNNQISMKVEYQDANGNPVGISSINQGTMFLMKVTVKNETDSYKSYLALNQVIPSGWEILNNRLYADEATVFTYQDYRHDRVVTFFDLKKGEQKEIVISLIATYLGDYYVPSTSCEAMYDNSVYARSSSARSVVSEK